MTPSPDEFEIVDESPWVARYPNATITMGLIFVSSLSFMGSYFVEKQLEPKFAEINKDIRSMATLQLETNRYFEAAMTKITTAANVDMPPRPKELDRAEDRVRKIQEAN
jgi:hypothetical protein